MSEKKNTEVGSVFVYLCQIGIRFSCYFRLFFTCELFIPPIAHTFLYLIDFSPSAIPILTLLLLYYHFIFEVRFSSLPWNMPIIVILFVFNHR